MARLYPLFSGSSGNSVYISHRGEGVLIDAGRSAKQIEKCLIDSGININSIRSIFITHEHNDHISALKVFASRYAIKVYASKGTLLALEKKGVLNGRFSCEVIPSEGICSESMHVVPFKTSHDCCEGAGYVINLSGGAKVGVCTDLGYISPEVKKAICGCNVLVIESNHDVNMLRNCPYPYYLKKRILSEKGHLSNKACAAILPYLVNKGLSRIVLSHLSEHSNTYELAFNSSLEMLRAEGMDINRDFTLNVAPKLNSGGEKLIF